MGGCPSLVVLCKQDTAEGNGFFWREPRPLSATGTDSDPASVAGKDPFLDGIGGDVGHSFTSTFTLVEREGAHANL